MKMKFKTKYLLPAIIAPMMVGCGGGTNSSTKHSATGGIIVTKCVKNEINALYIDVDGDQLADHKIGLRGSYKTFYDYAEVGDTIVFKPYGVSWNFSGTGLPYGIESVNNHTYDEILKILDLNRMRDEIGQQKVR